MLLPVMGHSAAPVSAASLPVDVSCYARLLTVHLASTRHHAIGGFNLPMGARQGGAQVYLPPGPHWGDAGAAGAGRGGRWVV